VKKTSLYFILPLLFLTSIMGCRKYNEDDDCYHQPSWRVCDSYDIAPTDYILTSTINTTDEYPIQLDIYNRTLLLGIGSLHESYFQNSKSQTYILPEGRYTASIQFENDSIVEQDFRVYSGVHEYCEGTCYTINNDEIDMIDPG